MKSDKPAELHNIYEYQFALKVVEELPAVLAVLDKTQESLYNYTHYQDVADVLNAINEAKLMLELHLDAYKPVVENKGKFERGKKS